ncbi:uncharacterized protein LOC107039530 [Diachasma alloeum]|uniref:uncharacterized protein LOC107039530 n=1 Tax=Diachasma alloeum TaxID=454923 RepID=UPI0007381874|nr:uncharacterized protein LOC107039530 [Diachasma alloeum]XP_015114667.1 uncharacterized protein LOC107039530 [Diachasma alloeum]
MNGNYRKMRVTGLNCISLAWFNARLFTVNGAPFRFHLVGFDPCEAYEIGRIIEAYGGKLSHPDSPDTFVFRDPGRPVTAEKYDLYNIKYFYDSIVALQRQDLINYRLQVSTKQPNSSFMNSGSTHSWLKKNHFDQHQDSMDYENQMSIDESSSGFADDDQCSQWEITEENNNKLQESMNYKLRAPTDERSTSPATDDQSAISHSNEESNIFYGEDRTAERSSSADPQEELTDDENSFTAARTRVYSRETKSFAEVHRLTENKPEVTSTEGEINRQDRDNSNETENENYESSSDDGDPEDSDAEDFSKTADDNLNPEAVVNDEFTRSSRRRRCSSLGGQSSENKRARWTFTEEENEKIMNWVIEKEVIPTDTGKNLWQEFLDEKILPDINCGPASLARHYANKLKNHPTIEKYREEAKATGRTLKHAPPRYTEEEDRVLIQYLIDNDAIHRAGSEKVWEECMEKCKELLHPFRTAPKLRSYFKQKLRTKYAKYTDDPEALKMFEGLEKKRKRRTRSNKGDNLY